MSASQQALRLLNHALSANIPTVLWGPPGIGKTDQVNQLCATRDWHLETIVAAIRQPDDFAGLPWVHDSLVELVPPAWAVRLVEAHQRGQDSVLFFDELSCTPPAVMSALLRVVLERVVGDLLLPPTTRIVAAANPPEQAAHGFDLAPPLANRLLHLDWPCPSVAEWTAWATDRGVSGLPVIGASRASAFLVRFPQYLLEVPKDEVRGGLAWPSPRSWARAANLIGDGDLSPADELGCVAGCVGEVAGAQYGAWQTAAEDLPDPEALLSSPSSWMPSAKRLDVLHATLVAVVTAVLARMSPQRWAAGWELVGRAADISPDVAVAPARRLARAWPPDRTSYPAPKHSALARLEQLEKELG